MKQTKLFIIALILVCIGCAKQEKPQVVDIDTYAYEGTITGKLIEFDTIVGTVGQVVIFDDHLLVALYKSKHTVMMLDDNFDISGLGFPMGQGPEEILSAWGSFGQLLTDTSRIALHDYNKNEIAVTRGKDFTAGYEKIKLPKVIRELSPRRLLQLNDGRYVMVKSFNYGLATCDDNDSIVDWPLGLEELDPENPNIDMTSMLPRLFGYARGRGIVGEAYGNIPAVILHNEDGSINTILKFGEVPNINTIRLGDKLVIRSMFIGEKYVYILFGNREIGKGEDPEMTLAIIDYDGNGVAKLTMKGTSAIAVNENKKYLAASSAVSDELIIYDLSSVPGLEL